MDGRLMDTWCAMKYCRHSTHTRGLCNKHHHHYRTKHVNPDPVSPRQLYRLTPTQLETRALAFAALIETPTDTDTAIARQVGCGPGTVYNYRRLIGLVNPRRNKDRKPREGVATIPHEDFWDKVAETMTTDIKTRSRTRPPSVAMQSVGVQHRNSRNRKWAKRQGPPR